MEKRSVALDYRLDVEVLSRISARDLSTLMSDMMRIGASLHDQTEQSLIALETSTKTP